MHSIKSAPGISSSLKRFFFSAFSALAVLNAVPMASGQGASQDPPVVGYNPTIQIIQGTLPYSQSYSVAITSPNNLPSNSSTVVSFVNTVNGFIPVGVSNATALGYVTFSPSTLTFTGPSQTQLVTVTMAVPANATPGDYGFLWKTTGWPADPTAGNDGSAINASATVVGTGTSPTVTIGTPVDGSTITVPSGGLPIDLPLTFTGSVASVLASDNITTVSVDLNGTNIALTSLTGLNSLSVSGSGKLHITAAGVYRVTAQVTNTAGTANDINVFTVGVNAPPPTVAINTPTAGSTYSIKAPGTSVTVPLTFAAQSNAGAVRTLTATLDGVPVVATITGIGAGTATGTASLIFSTANATDVGSHVLVATVTDDIGTATTTTSFTINYASPTPTIAIVTPGTATITLPSGATSTNIPFTFNTNTSAGFTVDTVGATFDGTTVAITSTTGLGSVAAVSTGTLAGVGAGTHTLTVNGVSAGVPVTASVSFTVVSAVVPPSVVINTPAAGATYTKTYCGPAVSVPLSFTGTSNVATGVITKLTATIDGTPVTVSSTTIGQKVATGTATLSISTAGTHTISVAAVDAYGTATASRTFTVTVVIPRNVCGTVFFDVNCNGVFDHGGCNYNDDDDDHRRCGGDDGGDRHSSNNYGDFGLSGATVKLINSANQVVATTTTDCKGTYCFSNVLPGSYVVSASANCGLKASSLSDLSITVTNSDVTVPAIGFGLDFVAIRGMNANGCTVNYWKTNLDKAISGRTSGIQVSCSSLNSYTKQIGCLGMKTFDRIAMKDASACMGLNSSRTYDVLNKNLIAAEYNYCKGAYINGDKTLTFLFICWGEYVSSNPGSYSSSYTTWAKNWFDAYNNSNGGKVCGPTS